VLKIHETYGEGDTLQAVHLLRSGSELVLATGDSEVVLPTQVLVAVFERYARPLEPDTDLAGPVLQVAEGIAVQHVRHLSPFDVIARDYLVLLRDGREPIADLAVAITGALLHLAEKAG
jgi:hypothetical protein